MPTHKLKRITGAADRVTFGGRIPAGTGHHDYLCAACGALVLERMHLRQPSAAVFECSECRALNVIAHLDNPPDEVVERLTLWYGDLERAAFRERRKGSR
jgi:predicted RNA-binding Zn-ribbon protein involved in translation (DUF1610 family)